MKHKKGIRTAGVIVLFFINILIFCEVGFRVFDRKTVTHTEASIRAAIEKDLKEKKLRDINQLVYRDEHGCLRRVANSLSYFRSNDHPSTHRVIIRINSLGIRGMEPIDSPGKRVLFIGDSVVLNAGVPLENTSVYQLEKRLNHNMSGDFQRENYKIEILNFGTTDSGIDQYYRILKYHGIQLNPEFVFIGFYLNDALLPQGYMGIHSMDGMEKIFESDFMMQFKFVDFIKRKYRLIKYTKNKELRQRFRWAKRFHQKRYYTDKTEFINLVKEADLDWGAAWLPESWEKVEYFLKKIKALCLSNGIKPVVFIYPVQPQVYSDIEWSEFDYPQTRLAGICKALSMPCFDLLPLLRKQRHENLYVDQCHFTSTGDRLVAEIIFRLIKDNPGIFNGLHKKSEPG